MKLRSRIAAFLSMVLLAAAVAPQAFAAENRPDYLAIDQAKVAEVNVIDRDLRACYRVTGAADRAAIVKALGGITPKTMRVEPQMDGLQLLQIKLDDGGKYEYWCHNNVLMYGETQVSDVLGAIDLYQAMRGCRENYPAAIEWLGYMNPYRVTRMEITVPGGGTTVYETARTGAQRKAILDLADKLRKVKVKYVQTLDGKAGARMPESKLYQVGMTFENGKEGYDLSIYENGRVTISVDSINYDLSYLAADDAYGKALWDALLAGLEAYAK